MDNLQGKNINQDDLAHLISQGVLKPQEEQKQNDKDEQEQAELEVELANRNISLLSYVYEEYSTHDNLGDIFSINFISFKPIKNIESLNNIPNKIFFKFSFWDFEEFSTAPAIITKPSELKASYLSTPPSFFIYKSKEENQPMQLNEEMKISITYDPSIENFIDYKNFLNYLLNRDLFIQIFDYEKQMPYGYIKIPLKNFIRHKKKSLLKNFSVNAYDNFTYEKKGEIELCLKSDEIKTIKEFNLEEQQEKFNVFYSQNQFINYKGNDLKENLNGTLNKNNKIRQKRKKVVSVPQMNFNQLTQIEKDLYTQKILEFKSKNNLKEDTNENSKGAFLQKTLSNSKTGYFLDQNLEKRIRVMRFLDTHIDDGKNIIANKKIDIQDIPYVNQTLLKNSLKRKQDEQNFYDTLNYTNYIKNINKESLIAKTIAENNKNILTIALIQGEPHYFNFILSNETSHQELYHIVISKNTDKKEKEYEENKHPYYESSSYKNENSLNFKDNVVRLVTEPKEFEYITILKGLKIPNGHDYTCVSKDGHVVVEPHQSVPLLFKCISFRNVQGYDDNIQSKYNIFIYNENNIPQYFLNINIIKVFPIIDFNFYFRVEEKKLSQIKFINPFKYDLTKTQSLLNTHHFINSIDKNSDINLKLDPLNNNFFFNFNNLTNLADNQINLNSEEAQNLYKTNNVDISLNSRKRMLFLYKDIYRAQLLNTFNFLINAFECINVCIDLGVKKSFRLILPEIDGPRTIKLYSSDENILFFQGKYNQSIMMIPNIRYEAEYFVYSKKIENNDILINCIDISNKEVLKTWLVKTAVNQPKVSQVIKVNCLIGNSTQVKFSFTSPLNTWSVLHFESSNRSMVELPVEQMAFNSEENKIITINICKSLIAGRGTAYVFISDSDSLFNQIVQVDIIYY